MHIRMDENKEKEKYWVNLESIFVHHVYDNISSQYDNYYKIGSNTNQVSEKCTDLDLAKRGRSMSPKISNKVLYIAWPKVKKFIDKLEPNSLIADVGCGEGKYLNLNQNIFSIGCDRSSSLCEFALKNLNEKCNSNQLLVCDNLALPFRSNFFDAVISIGVIHHFSTQKRRIKAIKELCRILRPGGKLMIYVWAMEQTTRKFKSQDVLVPLINNKTQFNFSVLNKDVTHNIFDSDLINKKLDKELCSTKSLKKQNKITQQSTTIKTNSLQNISIDEQINSENNNFVDNLRLFLIRKFSQKKKTEKNDEILTSSKPFASKELEKSFDSKTLERYKKILEEHKNVLPKDFTIRKFPHSSCQTTFDSLKPINKISEEVNATNKGIASEKEKNHTLQNKDLKNVDNSLNKRFYHVFVENELNNLVADFCPELSIYKTYYDHGNWCIIACKNF